VTGLRVAGPPARVGALALACPVMLASGTAGQGAELDPYVRLASLGAIVTKSVATFAWEGNPAPRLVPVRDGMINSVGLQGDGIDAFLARHLPALRACGATVVASIWGRTVADYGAAAAALAPARAQLAALEVNLSCPNLGGHHETFAHDPVLTGRIVEASAASGLPVWAKLSPATDRLVAVAGAAREAGAAAVTLINTVPVFPVDGDAGTPVLGAGRGGLSGRAIHDVAVRCVRDVRTAHPGLPIVGVGGVASAHDALDLMAAGASAVQVGTATFADPRAARRIARDLAAWASRRGVTDWARVAERGLAYG
jgi:dihydroorotate dehydrogenase (NAD+) catalytic subunit